MITCDGENRCFKFENSNCSGFGENLSGFCFREIRKIGENKMVNLLGTRPFTQTRIWTRVGSLGPLLALAVSFKYKWSNTCKKVLTWLLELLVPPWVLTASLFKEPSPAFVDTLLSPYVQEFSKKKNVISIQSHLGCTKTVHETINLFTVTTLVAQELAW